MRLLRMLQVGLVCPFRTSQRVSKLIDIRSTWGASRSAECGGGGFDGVTLSKMMCMGLGRAVRMVRYTTRHASDMDLAFETK